MIYKYNMYCQNWQPEPENGLKGAMCLCVACRANRMVNKINPEDIKKARRKRAIKIIESWDSK